MKKKKTLPKSPAPPSARIARVAKGKKPQYFSDPAIDKLLSITVSLMEELAVTRDRLDAVERLLARKRIVKAGEIDRFEPNTRDTEERATRRAAYVSRVLRALHAERDSDAEAVTAVES
jgi:hypothetical protein